MMSAKRRKIMPDNAAESCDLVDICSEIVAVKVGGTVATKESRSEPESEQAKEKKDKVNTETVKTSVKSNSIKDDKDETHTTTGDDAQEANDVINGSMGSVGDHDNQNGKDDHYAEQTFYVHKNVLCKSSRFFQAATKPRWTKSNAKPINLSDEDPKLFTSYVQWLYSQKIAIEIENLSTQEGVLKDTNADKCDVVSSDRLIQSYVLGEKLMDTTYQNVIIKSILYCVHAMNFYPNDTEMHIAYKGTLKSSPLRKLLIDYWVWGASESWISEDTMEDLGKEAVHDLLVALVERRPTPHRAKGVEKEPPWITDPTAYEVKDGEAKVNSNDESAAPG